MGKVWGLREAQESERTRKAAPLPPGPEVPGGGNRRGWEGESRWQGLVGPSVTGSLAAGLRGVARVAPARAEQRAFNHPSPWSSGAEGSII